MANINLTIKIRKTLLGKFLLSKPVQYLLWLPLVKLRIMDFESIKYILLKGFVFKVGDREWRKFHAA